MASKAAALPQSTQPPAGTGSDANVNLHSASEATAELRRRITQKHATAIATSSVDEYPADDESEDKDKDNDDKVEVNWGKTPSGEGESCFTITITVRTCADTYFGRVTGMLAQCSASPRLTRSSTP